MEIRLLFHVAWRCSNNFHLGKLISSSIITDVSHDWRDSALLSWGCAAPNILFRLQLDFWDQSTWGFLAVSSLKEFYILSSRTQSQFMVPSLSSIYSLGTCKSQKTIPATRGNWECFPRWTSFSYSWMPWFWGSFCLFVCSWMELIISEVPTYLNYK